jgi:hypothetical protein
VDFGLKHFRSSGLAFLLDLLSFLPHFARGCFETSKLWSAPFFHFLLGGITDLAVMRLVLSLLL